MDEHTAFAITGWISSAKVYLRTEDPKDLTEKFLEKSFSPKLPFREEQANHFPDDRRIWTIFNLFYAYGIDLPLPEEDFYEKLKFARFSHREELQNDMLYIWGAVQREDVEGVYKAVFRFFGALKDMETIQSSTFSSSMDLNNELDMQALQNHWRQPYVGPSCDVLRDKIREYERKFSAVKPRKYYSKTITFMQSSGTGKSRLASEYGSICAMITYVIREPDSGFPPSDDTVYHFMCSSPSEEDMGNLDLSPSAKKRDGRADYIWFHAVSIAILQATFMHCTRKVNDFSHLEKTHVALAASLRKLLEDPDQRNTLYDGIVQSAKKIASSCVGDQLFRRIFDKPDESIRRALEQSTCEPMKNLRAAINNFEDSLRSWDLPDESDPFFAIVFDEVGSLMDETGNGRFIALNRVISVISERHKIWYLFLSTESRLDALLPPDQVMPQGSGPNRPSSRLMDLVREPSLDRFPPFTSFAVDMHDLKNGFQINPSDESMSAFSKVSHMGKFGRALWSAYDQPDLIAEAKLIGGTRVYDPNNRDHVFAVLSIRLCLDVDLSNPITYPLSQTAVHLHMRVVKSVDPSTGYLFTRTPSEPVLALAATHHLCSSHESWPRSLQTFTSSLLSLGAINKGSKGELFARLVFILARDRAAEVGPTVNPNSERVVPIFSVKSFLQALFSEEYHEHINLVDQTILDAKLNFLMFTSTNRHLSKDCFGKLCHTLLRRSAALQCTFNQESYDLFIPFYCGDPSEPYDLSKAGVILVQIKNREREQSPGILLGRRFVDIALRDTTKRPRKRAKYEASKNVIFNHENAKLLYILLDLGVDGPGVNVSLSDDMQPKIWSIHATGHDEKVFGSIKEHQAVKVAKDFFSDIVKPVQENDIAFHHDADLLDNVLDHDKIEEETTEGDA